MFCLPNEVMSYYSRKPFLSNFKNIIWPTLGKQSVKLKSIIMWSTSVMFFFILAKNLDFVSGMLLK